MFKDVLISTDFSEYSDAIIDCIDQIPGVRRITLLHVIDTANNNHHIWLGGNKYNSSLDYASDRIAEQASRIKARGLEVVTMIETLAGGPVASTILRKAREGHVSLIVVGARGRGIISGLILGSVSEQVVRESHTDVLVVHIPKGDAATCDTSWHLLNKILCPVDFSKPSADLIASLKGISTVGSVLLLHVIKSAENKKELGKLMQDSGKNLTAMKEDLSGAGIKAREFVRFGEPSHEITALGEAEDASLILISRFGLRDYYRNIPIGSTAAAVIKNSRTAVLLRYPEIKLTTTTRELEVTEFPLAEEVWKFYHQQTGDPKTDRIFGVFLEEMLVAAARCKRHPDGLEVDAVFVPTEFRSHGYARMAVAALVEACGTEPLYMHATLELVDFYGRFGFVPIEEDELPPEIKKRFEFALGDLEGANVKPMRRMPVMQDTGSGR